MNKYFAYVDETQEGRYRLRIVSIDEGKLAGIRTALQALRLPGQNRLHMSKESARRRKQILQAVSALDGWKAFVIESAPKRRITVETRQELFLLAAQHPFGYRFEKPSQDEGLWVADVVGWSAAKGGEWKKQIREKITVLTAP